MRDSGLLHSKTFEGAQADSECSFQLHSTPAESHVHRSRFHASPLAKHQAMNSSHFMHLAEAFGFWHRQHQGQSNKFPS